MLPPMQRAELKEQPESLAAFEFVAEQRLVAGQEPVAEREPAALVQLASLGPAGRRNCSEQVAEEQTVAERVAVERTIDRKQVG